METREPPANDPEQQWIAKYRQAMNAAEISIQAGNNHTAAKTFALLTSKIGNLLTQWIYPKHRKKVTVKLGVANANNIRIPPRSARRQAS